MKRRPSALSGNGKNTREEPVMNPEKHERTDKR